jgi:hypothetical protein
MTLDGVAEIAERLHPESGGSLPSTSDASARHGVRAV